MTTFSSSPVNAPPDNTSDPRQLVALGSRVLAAHGHDDFIWGHLSARDPEGRGIWMKRSGLGLEEVTDDDIMLVGFDGKILEGDGPRHVEWPIHTEVHLARNEVGAVVHTHSPYCIAVAASAEPLRPVSHWATLFVPPDVPRFTRTANLIVTRELGQQVAEALGEQHALFLVNHGIVVCGSDVRDAVARAVLLEKACHHQLLTVAAGGITVHSSDEEALAKRETIWSESARNSLWEYLVRRLASDRRLA